MEGIAKINCKEVWIWCGGGGGVIVCEFMCIYECVWYSSLCVR